MRTMTIKKPADYDCKLGRKTIRTQKDSIQYFIHKMDIGMIDAILDDDTTYQEYDKITFLLKLQAVFERFQSFGDSFLIPVEGRCNFCDKTKTGFSFYGNVSKNYISIIFDTEQGNINDLYDCTSFQNLTNVVSLNEQIFFD